MKKDKSMKWMDLWETRCTIYWTCVMENKENTSSEIWFYWSCCAQGKKGKPEKHLGWGSEKGNSIINLSKAAWIDLFFFQVIDSIDRSK